MVAMLLVVSMAAAQATPRMVGAMPNVRGVRPVASNASCDGCCDLVSAVVLLLMDAPHCERTVPSPLAVVSQGASRVAPLRAQHGCFSSKTAAQLYFTWRLYNKQGSCLGPRGRTRKVQSEVCVPRQCAPRSATTSRNENSDSPRRQPLRASSRRIACEVRVRPSLN